MKNSIIIILAMLISVVCYSAKPIAGGFYIKAGGDTVLYVDGTGDTIIYTSTNPIEFVTDTIIMNGVVRNVTNGIASTDLVNKGYVDASVIEDSSYVQSECDTCIVNVVIRPDVNEGANIGESGKRFDSSYVNISDADTSIANIFIGSGAELTGVLKEIPYNLGDSNLTGLLKIHHPTSAEFQLGVGADTTAGNGVEGVFGGTNFTITNNESGYTAIGTGAGKMYVSSSGCVGNVNQTGSYSFYIGGTTKAGFNPTLNLIGGGEVINATLANSYAHIGMMYYKTDRISYLNDNDKMLQFVPTASGVADTGWAYLVPSGGEHAFHVGDGVSSQLDSTPVLRIKEDTIDFENNILIGVKTATGNDTSEAVNVAYFDRMKTGFNSKFDSTSAPISLALTTTPSHLTNSNNDLWSVNNITGITYSNDTITYNTAYVYDCELEVTLTGISGTEIITDIYNITDDNIIRKSVWRMFGNTEQITVDVNYKDFDADAGDKIVPRIYLESGASTVNIDSGTLQIDYHSNK